MEIKQYTEGMCKNEAGIISGIPNSIYHSSDSIGSSKLKSFIKNPRLFALDQEKESEEETKDCFKLGSAFHCLCLESEYVFNSEFVHESLKPKKPTKPQLEAFKKFNDLTKPTKTQKGAWLRTREQLQNLEVFDLHHGKKDVLTDIQYKDACAMRDSFLSDEDVQELLFNFVDMHKELTFRTPMLECGFQVQTKCDIYDEENCIIYDLKSIKSLDDWDKQFFFNMYYLQAAFYVLPVQLMTGKLPKFYFIAVESSAPYEVAIKEVSEEYIMLGIEQIKANLQKLGDSLKSGSYNKRYPGITDCNLSDWQVNQIRKQIDG